MKTASHSENLCEFNRRQTSFVSQDKYDIYKRGGSLYGRVGAGQWPEGATTRRVAATHDALLFAQRSPLLQFVQNILLHTVQNCL